MSASQESYEDYQVDLDAYETELRAYDAYIAKHPDENYDDAIACSLLAIQNDENNPD